MEVELNSLIGIFTVIDNKVCLYKNFFKIPVVEDIDICNTKYINNLEIKNVELKQCHTFIEKSTNKLIVTVLYVDIVNKFDLKDYNLFVPVYDMENEYMKYSIEFLKQNINCYDIIKKVFPNTFTLPELQKSLEYLYKEEYDRRNFRKRMINLNILEEVLKSNEINRMAKKYKFKDSDIKNIL